MGVAVDGDHAVPVSSLASQEGLRGDDLFGIGGILERPGEDLLDPVETLPDHRHLKLEEGHLLIVGGERPGLLHRLGGFVDLPMPHLPGGHDLPRCHVFGRQFDHPLHDLCRRLRIAAVSLENPCEVGEGLGMAGGRLEGGVELSRPPIEAGEGGEDRLGLVELPGARSHRRIEQVDANGVVVGLAGGAPVSDHGEVVAGGVGVPRPGQERCQFFAEVVFLGVSPDRHFEGRERRADGAGAGLARIDLPEEDFGILALPRGIVRPEGDVPPQEPDRLLVVPLVDLAFGLTGHVLGVAPYLEAMEQIRCRHAAEEEKSDTDDERHVDASHGGACFRLGRRESRWDRPGSDPILPAADALAPVRRPPAESQPAWG